MKSPLYFVVEPVGDKLYDSTTDYGLILSASKEDHTATNRFATVIATPIGYTGEIVPGDTLMVHHNVFRKYFDVRGKEKYGPSHFRDSTFFIDFDQFFLYKHDDVWKAPHPYCMVKPVENDNSTIIKSTDMESPLVGILKYGNEYLYSKGLKDGDMISFQPESEYPFTVDGEKLYRMFSKNICVAL
jgi:hypothetical protein